jgi:hypothetical protein
MNTFALDPKEEEVLTRVSAIMNELKTDSQYKVLRKLAHLMNRQVVRPGAVRTAAAAASAGANRAIVRGSAPSSLNPSGKPKKVDPIKKDWEATPQAKSLIDRRDRFKASFAGREPTDQEKTQLSEISAQIRENLEFFRAQSKLPQNTQGAPAAETKTADA